MISRVFEIKDKKIEIQQNLDFGHAGSVWDAALVFAHYLEKNYDKIHKLGMFFGKQILELGSGTGVAGLLTTMFNPQKVILTDMKQNQDLLKRNIEVNVNNIQKGIQVENYSLEWGKENFDNLKEIIKQYEHFDIVLGSDLMYDDANSVKLLETFDEISLLIKGCVFILVYNIRKESERQIIKRIESNFEFEYVSESDYDELFRDEDIGIIMFKSKQ
ncbi:hypothetical protein ABPG72_000068 [Tetrahymena utriculariae]